MYRINEIKQICKELDIRILKSKGQNFLISESVRDRIIQSADLKGDETVLEIGPGLGALTEELVKKSKVVAVELDKKLYGYLKSKKLENLELVQGDILNFLYPSVPDIKSGTPPLSKGRRYNKVVANLPYRITSRVLRLLLESENPPSEIIVMVQKEVGERIVAEQGKMSILSVMAQYYSEPKILFNVAKGNFWPRPKVTSVVLKLKTQNSNVKTITQNSKLKIINKNFFKLVKTGFSAKRKMLKNNLASVYGAEKAKEALKRSGLNEKTRAQELSVDNWVKLANCLDKF